MTLDPGSRFGPYEVLPDGSAVIALEKRVSPALNIVQNWFAKLTPQVPLE